MLYKSLLIVSLALFMSSCQSKITPEEEFEFDQSLEEQEEQEFEILSEEEVEEINEEVEEVIEEVEVSDRVFFAFDSSELSSEAKMDLDNQVAWLRSDSGINIIIEGHCDERGTREYNIALGERRAEAAKDYLVSMGIEDRRIKTISYGKERPAFLGSGLDIWSKNRRAVTIIDIEN